MNSLDNLVALSESPSYLDLLSLISSYLGSNYALFPKRRSHQYFALFSHSVPLNYTHRYFSAMKTRYFSHKVFSGARCHSSDTLKPSRSSFFPTMSQASVYILKPEAVGRRGSFEAEALPEEEKKHTRPVQSRAFQTEHPEHLLVTGASFLESSGCVASSCCRGLTERCQFHCWERSS